MRLLVVGVSRPLETFLERLIRGLAEKGFRITLVSRKKPHAAWVLTEKISWFPLSLLKLFPFLARRWDVIYFPWNSAAIENLKFFDQGVPAVVSCRGSQINSAPHNPNRNQIKEGLGATFRKAALVHCVSQAIQNEAMQYGLTLEKSRVIYPAVDTDFFFPGESRSEDPFLKIVTIGNLSWVKGHEYALLTIRKLLDAKIAVRYEIIGEGPDRQRILYTIQDLALEKNVFLSGRLSPEKVRDRLRKSDVFLLSSLSEGISNAALEAMACGLPIITTDCGGMREAITDGVEGFAVPVRDPEAMEDSLKNLAEDPDLRFRMGNAAREKILKNFTLGEQINRFANLFERAREKSLCAA